MAFGDNISQGKNMKATGGGADNLQTVEETMEDKFVNNAIPKAHCSIVLEGPDAYLIAQEIIGDLKIVYAKYDAEFISGCVNVYWNPPPKKKEETDGRDHPPKSGNGKDRK